MTQPPRPHDTPIAADRQPGPYAGPAGEPAAVATTPWRLAPFVPLPWRTPAGQGVGPVVAEDRPASAGIVTDTAVPDGGLSDAFAIDTAALRFPSLKHTAMHPSVPEPAEPAEAPAEEGEEPAQGLPWIDAFLEEAPASSEAEPVSADEGEGAAPSDAWPLDEAGAQMSALADGLSAPGTEAAASDGPMPEAEHVPPVLPAWQEDDWMDIMPTLPSLHGAADGASGPAWASLAREEQSRQAEPESGAPTADDEAPTETAAQAASHLAARQAEAAADALESLALRVRSGELPVPGFQPELGDAAALAAALAALLGVRK